MERRLSMDEQAYNLKAAMDRDDLLAVMLALHDGVSPDVIVENVTHETALIYAAKWMDRAVVKLLLDHGADVYEKDYFGGTALTYAITNEDLGMVQDICQYAANPRKNERFYALALRDAVYVGNVPIIQFLLQQGADPTLIIDLNSSALEVAVKCFRPHFPQRKYILDMLLRHCTDRGLNVYDGFCGVAGNGHEAFRLAVRALNSDHFDDVMGLIESYIGGR